MVGLLKKVVSISLEEHPSISLPVPLLSPFPSILESDADMAQRALLTNPITPLMSSWVQSSSGLVGFCSGAIAGLVAITPGSGYVGSPAAVLFGFMAGTLCNFATQLKFVFGYDDCLDIFASHGIGGMVGNVLTGLFAQASVAGFDGFTVIPGGWLDHNYIQLGWQLADSASGFAYSFTMTTVILWIMHFIPGLRLRADDESEILGIDDAEMGEYAYDYVGLETELHPTGDLDLATGGGREPEHHHHHVHSEKAGSAAST